MTTVRLSTFVAARVKLSLGLSNEMTLDMLSHRDLCLKEGVNKLQMDGDGNEIVRTNMDGRIRLGLDFIELAPTSQGENPYDANRDLLDGCAQRVLLTLENGVNRLLAHYADLFVKTVQGDTEEGWITSSSYASHCDKMISEIREALLSSYFLGSHDGQEHGRRDLITMLGNNPSGAAWFLYVKPLAKTSERWDKRNSSTSSRIIPSPVCIDTQADRTEQWNALINQMEDALDSLEMVILNLLRFRVRLFFLRGKSTPVNLGSPEKFETLICSKAAVVAEKMYNIGFFNGVEEGQAHVKEGYKRFRDDKIYTLLGDDRSKWILVDTTVPYSCDCGQCPPCIGNKSGQSGGAKQLNRRFAADELKFIAKECVGIQIEK